MTTVVGSGSLYYFKRGAWRAVGAGFSPTYFPGLVGWWDASDTSTITESGGAVSQLDDKSGNGFHVVQATAAAQPTTGSVSLNGLNVLDFDGGDWLASSGNIGVSDTTNFNVFAVATLDVAATYSTIFGAGNFGFATQAAGFQVSSYSALVRQMATDFWAPAGLGGSTSLATSTPYILSWSVEPWDDMRTTGDFRLNGVDETESNYRPADGRTPDLQDGPAVIGAFGPVLTTSRWNGQIAEVIVYDAVMDATQVAEVEQYLSDKWRLALA